MGWRCDSSDGLADELAVVHIACVVARTVVATAMIIVVMQRLDRRRNCRGTGHRAAIVRGDEGGLVDNVPVVRLAIVRLH